MASSFRVSSQVSQSGLLHVLVGPKIGECYKREFYEREIMSARTLDGYFQYWRIFASRAVRHAGVYAGSPSDSR